MRSVRSNKSLRAVSSPLMRNNVSPRLSKSPLTSSLLTLTTDNMNSFQPIDTNPVLNSFPLDHSDIWKQTNFSRRSHNTTIFTRNSIDFTELILHKLLILCFLLLSRKVVVRLGWKHLFTVTPYAESENRHHF